jgi:hypothetical protein
LLALTVIVSVRFVVGADDISVKLDVHDSFLLNQSTIDRLRVALIKLQPRGTDTGGLNERSRGEQSREDGVVF